MTTSNNTVATNSPIAKYTFAYLKDEKVITDIVIQETQKIGGKWYVTKAWDFHNKKPFTKPEGGYYLLSSFTRK